jgi:hypothetical protein
MERVVKRYFLHNQGSDLDDPKQNEFDDIKAELQTMRYEMISDMKKSKEDSARNMYIVNGSIQFIAEEVMINYKNDCEDHQSLIRYKELLNAHQSLLSSFNSFSACLQSDYNFSSSSSNTSNISNTTSNTTIAGDTQSETQNFTSTNSNINNNEYLANNNNSRKRGSSVEPLNEENSNFINNNFSKSSIPSKVTFDLFENKILHTITEESNSQFNSSK